MKKLILLTVIFTLSDPSGSLAAAERSPVRLDTVTVIATRSERDIQDVPNMVSIIDADAPSNRTASKISDLFKDVSGVEFGGGPVRYGENPTIRGFDADSILMTLDGRRQNFESQHSSKSFIDPSLIKRVEVVKGPASASYGTGAIGGVVAFETKDAKDFAVDGRTSGMQLSLSGQTADHEFSEMISGYKLGNDYDAVASITRRDSGNIDLNNDTTQRSDDGLTAGFAKITYDLTENSSIKFDVSSFYDTATENANPQTIDPSQDNLQDKNIFSHQAGVTYKYNPDKLIDLSTQLYFVDTAIEETVVEPTGLTNVGDDLDRTMRTIGFNLDNRSVLNAVGQKENTFAYGVELFRNQQNGSDTDSGSDSGVPGGRAGVPDAKSLVSGVYIQDEIPFDISGNTQLVLTPGARFDYYNNEPEDASLPSDTATRLSPKFGSVLKIYRNYSLFGNYAEAFRAPNLTELYAAGTHFSVDIPGPIPLLNNSFVQNPGLRPESSRTFEFGGGLEFSDLAEKEDEFRVRASRYITRASNYIEQFITGPNFGSGACPAFPFNAVGCNFGTTGWRNVDSANIWGYELDSKYENSLLEAGFNLSYVSAENARTGRFLSTKQPLIASTNIGYKIDGADLTVGYLGKYVDGLKKGLVDTSDPNFTVDYRRPGFATHGIYLSYEPKRYKNISLDFAVDNLFDKKYRVPFSEIYDMERNYKLRLTFNW